MKRKHKEKPYLLLSTLKNGNVSIAGEVPRAIGWRAVRAAIKAGVDIWTW